MLEAEGRREAAFRDAEARERSAEAEAKATTMVSDAIASGNVQAINYFVANNYIKALEVVGAIAQSEDPDAAGGSGLRHRLDRRHCRDRARSLRWRHSGRSSAAAFRPERSADTAAHMSGP